MGWGDTPHTPRQGVEPPAPPEYNQIKHLSKTNRVTPVTDYCSLLTDNWPYTTPRSRNAANCSASYPNTSPYTLVLCSPRRGGKGRRSSCSRK